MSRIYEALRRAEIGRDRPADAMPQGDAHPTARPVEVKPPQRWPARKESSGSDSHLLFHAEPMENVARWAEAYVPQAGLSREDAIRQWLAMAPDSRAQAAVAGPEKEENLPKRELSPAALGENTKKHTAQPQQILRGAHNPPTTRSGKYGRSFVNFVAYSVLAILLVRLTWLPLNKAFSEADPPLRANQASTTGATFVPKTAPPQLSEVSAPQASTSEGPSRIERISIACDDAQPCVVINTLGKDVHPTLSTLTGPDRLVLDFRNVLYLPAARRIAVERGLVKAVRIGCDQKAQIPATRVVVDLETQSDYKLQTRADGFMLKIYPKAPARPE